MPSRTQQRAKAPRSEASEPTRALVKFDAKAKANDLVKAIDERHDQLAAFLQARSPEEYDRFVNIAVDSIVRDTNLLSADLLSLVASIRHAAIMGLEATSIMGEGAIVVYRDGGQGGKKIAQFQPMYRGLMKLARNSGEILSIGCDVVRRKDRFVYRSGSAPVVDHEPFIPGFTKDAEPEEGNDVVGAYAFLKLRSGELVPLFMSTAEINKRRAVSKSFQSSGEQSIWGQWWEEQAKKTVLARLMREKAPLSFRAQQALSLAAEIDSPEGEPEKVEAVVSRTAARLAAHVDGTENGSGPAEPDKADTGATDKAVGAQDGPDDATEAAVRVMCNAPNCVREAHGDAVNHRNADVETWAKVPGDSRDG